MNTQGRVFLCVLLKAFLPLFLLGSGTEGSADSVHESRDKSRSRVNGKNSSFDEKKSKTRIKKPNETFVSELIKERRKKPLLHSIPDGVVLGTHSAGGRLSVRSWKSLRDDRIVKQDLDHSCGAASLATLLGQFYGKHLSEETLLRAMDKGDDRASFDDMAKALPRFGFKAQGFAANWEQLAQLRVPVIVYLKYRKDDHFSVLRGIDANTVWLADPSQGNRTFSKEQFLEMWLTRKPKDRNAHLRGKFLAVIPVTQGFVPQAGFFTRNVNRQTEGALQQLEIRQYN